jgi:hypothetical protein
MAGHVTFLGEKRAHIEFCWENLKEIYHWKDICVDERLILKLILKKEDSGLWTGFTWLRVDTSGGPFITVLPTPSLPVLQPHIG